MTLINNIKIKNKYHNDSEYVIDLRQYADFNICKLITKYNMNSSKEFLDKKNNYNSNLSTNNKTFDKSERNPFVKIKEKHFNTNTTNKFYKDKKVNKGNKNNFHKIKDNLKDKETSINNNYSTITKDNKKAKDKKISIKPNKLHDKKIHFKKNISKLPYNINNNPSIELEFTHTHMNIQTEPSIKKTETNPTIKSQKSKNNKNLIKKNKKISNRMFNNIRKQPLSQYNKNNLISPFKKNKIRQKLINANFASLFNTFERKQFETAHSNYHTNNNDNIKNLKKETINKTRTTFNQKLNKKNNVKNDNQNKSKSRSISKPKKITINLFNDKNNKLLTQESSSNKDNNKKNYKKYILNDIKPKSKNTNNNAQNKKKEILIVNQKKSSNKNESLEKKEKSKLSKINKFINILSKSKEDFSHMIKNKKNDINKKNKNYLTNRIKTHHSDVHKNKNVSKNKSLKFATIRLSDLYQNNNKMKEKVRNNYLIEKGKTSTDMNSINNAIKNKPNNNLITDKSTV
jgi:hypothetical protein